MLFLTMGAARELLDARADVNAARNAVDAVEAVVWRNMVVKVRLRIANL